jgi:hypothetical protein
MALVLSDRVQETGAVSSGTGSVALAGAVNGYQTFSATVGNGNTTYYAIYDTTAFTWEVGIGTYTNSPSTLARTTVLSSSNSGSLVSFSTVNTLLVWVDYPSSKSVNLDASGNVSPLGTITSGVWNGSTVGTAYGGTGLTTFTSGGAVYATSTSALTTGTLPVTAGGTGAATLTGYLVGNGTSAVTAVATIPNAGLTNSSVTVGTTSIALGASSLTLGGLTSVAVTQDPATALQLATKQYVDGLVSSGIHYHTPVLVESPINLTATYNNGASGVGATLTNAGTQAALVIDGVTLSVSDRVLIYAQTNQTQNGIYDVTSVGSGSTNWVLTRSSDADTYGLTSSTTLGEGSTVFVQAGSTGAGQTYTCNTAGVITFGTTNITFVEISSSQIYSAGTGLTLTGTQFSITPVGTAGTYGSATQTPVITTNASGQVSSVTNTTVTPAVGSITGLGTGVATALAATPTGSGSLVLATGPTLVTPALGTPVSGNFSTGTFTWPTFNQNTTGTAANVTGTVAVGNGGTGLTSLTAGRVPYGNGTSAFSNSANFIYDGTNFSVTNGYITAGSGISTAGSIVMQGYYNSGAIAVWGTEFSNGSPQMMYACSPSTSAAGAYLSSTPAALPRSAFALIGTDFVFNSGGSQTVAIGSAVTLSEKMRLNANGALAFGGSSNYGTSGQVLISQGNASPIWSTNIAGNAATATTATNQSGGTVNATTILAGSGVSAYNGVGSDPYGFISVTEPANASNYSYFGLTRSGVFGGAFGLTGSTGALGLGANAFWFGSGNSGAGGTMQTAWLAFNGSSLVTVGSVTATSFSGAGTGLTGTASSLTAGAATTATTATTANSLATGNNYQVNSLGVGTGASGTAGEIRATNNITAFYSDERLKTKVGNIENALDKVKQIETMLYHANETAVALGYDASIIEVGVTAQSVQKVQPEVVVPAPIDDKYLTVRYEKLVPLLIEAIKELEAKVAQLEAK